MKSTILEFWKTLQNRPCLIVPDGSHTYQDLLEALQRPTEYPLSQDFTWLALLNLLQAALYNLPFGFNSTAPSPGLWLQTTGTTGEPKWVHHSWQNWLAQYRWKDGGEKALLHVMAFDHIGGLHGIFSGLSRGMTIVVPAAKDGDSVRKAIIQHKVFLLPTTPAHLALLFQSGCFNEPLPHLRLISYGAEAMSPSLKWNISELQPHIHWRETYGSTETGILPLQGGSAPGSWQPNFPYQVVAGELQVRNLAGEWQATGDFVEELGPNRLHFLGRKATRVKVGGILVAPEHTAAWLRQQPNVWQVVVEAVPNPLLGQVLVAHIWASPDADLGKLEMQLRSSFPANFPKEASPVRYRFEEMSINERMKLEERWK